MRTLRLVAFNALLGLLIGGDVLSTRGQAPTPAVDVKVFKYDDLCDFVLANKGKVILLDFWATTCIPCKESFFHTVEMANRYRDKGLVVISVSTNPLEKDTEATVKASVTRFLTSQKATFTNVILDEPIDVLKKKLRLVNIPCIYVFDRDGKWTQLIDESLQRDADHRHPNVEHFVKTLLEQSAATK